jgi:hypothetical protein
MRYWWVNQNQTYLHEVAGGYLWSPKRKANGHINPYYESMREVSPGDVVLSFRDTLIPAIGIAQSNCYECPKPLEFGNAGMYWSDVGWKVDVRFTQLLHKIRPSGHMDALRQHLPRRYSPLSLEGRGSQAVYLTEIPEPLFVRLKSLIGAEADHVLHIAHGLVHSGSGRAVPAEDMVVWEEHLRNEVENDATIPETDREAIVLARRGQGLFRRRVGELETRCRVTGVSNPEHLRASHCKPWRDSGNDERLDGENGLLLTPSIDHLFDRGFISFEGYGRLLISPVAHRESLQRMGVKTEEPVKVGTFSEGQRRYLEFHRERVFLLARRK